MKEVINNILNNYQWLIGLIIGFILNQVAVSLERKRRKKDTKNIFKKHMMFIKIRLDYMSLEVEKIPNIIYMSDDYRSLFIKNLEEIIEELRGINKSDIPDTLVEEITELVSDFQFFRGIIKSNQHGKNKENDEDDIVKLIKEIADRQRNNVIKIFNHLRI